MSALPETDPHGYIRFATHCFVAVVGILAVGVVVIIGHIARWW